MRRTTTAIVPTDPSLGIDVGRVHLAPPVHDHEQKVAAAGGRSSARWAIAVAVMLVVLLVGIGAGYRLAELREPARVEADRTAIVPAPVTSPAALVEPTANVADDVVAA